MEKKVTVSIYHDTRRIKNDGTYPVKLRVYYSGTKMRYPAGLDLTEEGFTKSYLTKDPRGKENIKNKNKLVAIEAKANSIIDKLDPFSFDKFKKKMFRPVGSDSDVFSHYKDYIACLKREERIKTAISYECSYNSLVKFLKDTGKKTEKLLFDQVNNQFLNDYERWMVKEGNSLTTVGIYLRPLRAIFNSVIEAGDIDKDLYPFSKKKYQIPAGMKVKKALTKEDLKKLFTQEVQEDSPLEKARDFWFFSYSCSGINIRDIAELKEKNIKSSSITFIRTKTKRTTKSNSKPIIAAITPFIKQVIEKYGNKNRSKESYVFPILNHSMNAEERIKAVNDFIRFINQHMKNLAKAAKVDQDLSTYFARHSFASIAIQNGASMEFVKEQLGHQNINTTENYFKGFEENVRKEIADKLMDFDS